MTVRPFFVSGWVHAVLFVVGVLLLPDGPAWRIVCASVLLMLAGTARISWD